MADHTLDIRGLLCPVTWARVRRALQPLHDGDRLVVTLDHRPAVPDIKRNSAELGHEVERVTERDGTWELEIVLGAGR